MRDISFHRAADVTTPLKSLFLTLHTEDSLPSLVHPFVYGRGLEKSEAGSGPATYDVQARMAGKSGQHPRGEKEDCSVVPHYARSLAQEESRAGIINSTSNSDDHQQWRGGHLFPRTPSSVLHSSSWVSQGLEGVPFRTGFPLSLCVLLHSGSAAVLFATQTKLTL